MNEWNVLFCRIYLYWVIITTTNLVTWIPCLLGAVLEDHTLHCIPPQICPIVLKEQICKSCERSFSITRPDKSTGSRLIPRPKVWVSLSHCCPNLILITHVQLKNKWVGIMYICVYNKQINFRHVKLGREKLRNLWERQNLLKRRKLKHSNREMK